MGFRGDKRTSPTVKDLLNKMLEKDPVKRISVDEIMNHMWFRHNLPKDTFEMNKDIENEGPKSQASDSTLKLCSKTSCFCSLKKQ